MNRLERHNRWMLKMVGLDPARMTKAQIKRGVNALVDVTGCECVPGANRGRHAAIAAWRKLVNEVCQRNREGSAMTNRSERERRDAGTGRWQLLDEIMESIRCERRQAARVGRVQPTPRHRGQYQ